MENDLNQINRIEKNNTAKIAIAMKTKQKQNECTALQWNLTKNQNSMKRFKIWTCNWFVRSWLVFPFVNFMQKCTHSISYWKETETKKNKTQIQKLPLWLYRMEYYYVN